MSWVKVDDGALDDPRFLALPRGHRLLHLEALAWSARHGMAGRIDRHVLPRLGDEPDPEVAAAALVAAKLWRKTTTGWQLVFLQEDQLTPEDIAHQRERNRHKQARLRKHRQGDHSLCDSRYCKAADANPVSNPVSNRGSNRTPTQPTPTQPNRVLTAHKVGLGNGASAQRDEAAPAAPSEVALAKADEEVALREAAASALVEDTLRQKGLVPTQRGLR